MTDFFTTALAAGDDGDGFIPTNTAMRDDTSSDSEENGPRKRVRVTKKKSRKEIFNAAIKELQGGSSHHAWTYCMAITSFVLAIGASIFGIFTPWEEINGTYRCFSIMAQVFMVNQSFMFVKTVRDGEIISMKDAHGRIPAEYYFLQGGMPGDLAPHRAVCFGCLFLSILAEAYGIAIMDAQRYTQMFIGLSTLYVLSASLNLGWLLRDRFEAEVWEGEEKGRSIGSNKVELAVKNIMKVLGNMQEAMKFMFFFIGVMAMTMTIYSIIDFGVKEKGVGLISAGIVFSVASAWSMAQALTEEGMQDDALKMHRAATVLFFLLAVILTVVGICEMEIPRKERAVIGLGVLIILDATLNFARVVYRISHVKKLLKKVNKAFHLHIEMEDTSKNIFNSALDTFATLTDDAGRNNQLPNDFVYSQADQGGPPPPPAGYEQGPPQYGYDQGPPPPAYGYDQGPPPPAYGGYEQLQQ